MRRVLQFVKGSVYLHELPRPVPGKAGHENLPGAHSSDQHDRQEPLHEGTAYWGPYPLNPSRKFLSLFMRSGTERRHRCTTHFLIPFWAHLNYQQTRKVLSFPRLTGTTALPAPC